MKKTDCALSFDSRAEQFLDKWRCLVPLAIAAFLSGCPWEGDPKDPVPPTPTPVPVTYTVGGNVSGLNGSIIIANNGGDARTLTTAGAFTFATSLATGAAYNITVTAQPASQTCTVGGATGTIASSNVTSVAVTCVTNTYTIGGTVSGLTGTGLVLQNNGADNLTRNTSGAFTFATAATHGGAYNVTVLTQPIAPVQTCTPTGNTGTATAAVASVTITCVTTPTVGSASIGPAGGIVNGFYGATITVPAGALANTVTIGLTRDSSNSPAFAVTDVDAAGATYELTPHGQAFSLPVTLHIPFDPASVPDDATPTLYKAEVGGAFTAIPTTVNGGFLDATVTNFSWDIAGFTSTKPRMVYALQAAGTFTAAGVASYRINRTTGALTGPTSTALTGAAPLSVVAHPSRRFLYVSHGGSATANNIDANTIAVYQLNTINGGIAATPSSTATTGTVIGSQEPSVPVIHPTGKFMYVVNHGRFSASGGDIARLNISGTTGALSGLANFANGSGAPVTGIAFNRLGTFAFVTYAWSTNTPTGNTFYEQVKVYSVDLGTGALTGPISSAAAGSNPWSVAVDPVNGFVYVASYSTNEVRAYAVNGSGAISFIGSATVQNQPSSLSTDSLGRFLYAGKQNPLSSVNVLSYQITPGTGALTLANALLSPCIGGACVGPTVVAADPQGDFLYAVDIRQGLGAFRVNATTGVLTAAGTTSNVFVPWTGGIGNPFTFAVTGSSPVWQNNCTLSCVMSSSGGGGGGGGSNPNPPTSHHLTVTQGPFYGGVLSSPAGINIQSPFPNNPLPANDFSAAFPANSSVQLCASEPPQPPGPYDITWTGGCSGTGQCTSVSMTSDKQCHVEFTRIIGR